MQRGDMKRLILSYKTLGARAYFRFGFVIAFAAILATFLGVYARDIDNALLLGLARLLGPGAGNEPSPLRNTPGFVIMVVFLGGLLAMLLLRWFDNVMIRWEK